MRSLPIIFLFGFFVVLIHSRPSQTDESSESDVEDAEYGSEDKAVADDSLDGDSRINDDASEHDADRSELMDTKKNAYSLEQRNLAESRADRSHSELSDYKLYGNPEVRNDKVVEIKNYDDGQNYPKQRQSKYIDNKDAADQQEAGQHLTNRNVNYFKNNHIHNSLLVEDPHSKREAGSKPEPNEQYEMLFGSRDRAEQAEKNNINEKPFELNKRYSKYLTQLHGGNKESKNRAGDHGFFNRDRRESKDLNIATSKIEAEKESDKNQNEDEEMAIRRHIKKLSSDELEELLSSLSEEKRQLLKSIIDDTDLTLNINDNVNKREITKKAGAVEENSFMESGQADSGVHGDSSALDISTADSSALSSDTTETNKKTDTSSENSIITITKSTESKPGKKVGPVDSKEKEAEFSGVGAEKTPAEIVPSDQVTTKTENKRETNIDDLADIVSFQDPKTMNNDWLTEDSKDQPGYFCSQDEDLSQFLDDEQAEANDDSKLYKRDVDKQADYDAKLKSLEESFPKSSNYDESSGPLIRVKRKNEPGMKKRSAGILPDAKVAFVPYRAENDDEDNDEGNEFDEDGFYDRTPNFSNNAKLNIRDVSRCKLNAEDTRAAPNDISKGASLGSDTDGVLSHVEGVDENLMFNSASRNKRTTEDNSDVLNESNSIHNAKSLSEETKAVSDMNALTYQESDSFGPLPRNNEGDSGRYKRIRRVKQSHSEDAAVVS